MIIKIGTGDMCIMENVYVVMVEEYDDKPEPIGIVHNEELAKIIVKGLNDRIDNSYPYYWYDGDAEVWA